MPARFPEPTSPQAHRIFELVAPPAASGRAAWLLRRNPAATFFLLVAAIEGTTAPWRSATSRIDRENIQDLVNYSGATTGDDHE